MMITAESIEGIFEAKLLTDEATGQPWVVCVLLPGTRSLGRPAYKFNGREAAIEFYDARQDPAKFPPMGQFVSDYYVSTLLDHVAGSQVGLNLHGGVDCWLVSHRVVVDAVKHCLDVLHALLP